MAPEWINALIGGGLIGVSVSLMMFLNGRITGISGILSSAMGSLNQDSPWRILFLLGLFLGGVLMNQVQPDFFKNNLTSDSWTVMVAGLLVGFGTVMGSGCTSGHGVCGMSRLSPRSIVATLVFMAAGILSVLVFKKIGVL